MTHQHEGGGFDLMLADRMYYYMQWLADMLVKFKYAIR
jgi:hypothetical protein